MSDEVDTTPTDQPDPKAIVGGAFSAAAETYDQVVGFFAPFGRALVAAADPDRGTKVLDIAAVAVPASTRRSTPSAPTARCSASTSRRGWSSSSTPSSPPKGSATPRRASRRRGPRPARWLVRCGHRRVHDLLPARPAASPPGAAPGAGAGRHPRLVDLRRAVRLPVDGRHRRRAVRPVAADAERRVRQGGDARRRPGGSRLHRRLSR